MKFAPQTHLFAGLTLLAQITAPALVRANPNSEPRPSSICSRINTPTAMFDEKERKQNREKLLRDLKKALNDKRQLHLNLGDATNSRNTAAAVNAQTVYYDYLDQSITGLCDTQRKIHNFFLAYQNKISVTSQLTDQSDNAICGAFKETEDLYTASSTQIGQFNSEQEKLIDELKKVFRKSAYQNRVNIDVFTDQPPTMQRLKAEFAAIWGASFIHQTETQSQHGRNTGFPMDRNSVFGNTIYHIEQNKDDSKEVVKKMETARASMAASHQRCAMPAAVNPAAQIPGQSESDLENPYGLQISEDPDKADPDNDEKNPGDVEVEATAPPPAPPPPPEAKEEGWVSKNKGLLLTAGVGAAAVGGILWYKKSQDKKAKGDLAMLEAEASARAGLQNSSSSSDSSGENASNPNLGGAPANTSTPHGSKFVLSGIPAGAQVDSDLAEITASIIDPQGIQTLDSSTEVTVSCAAPIACSLSGTLTVISSGGKAVFRDLRFTAPHEGVKLTFSAPGFAPVTSASPFNVTGTANGAPRE